ncbi:MAG: PQQ-binding-like beta-propeller repeat protein [Pirellulales bacterium]|nr:PQQ-binding-like beta-propeller repeat protein [Pirellulales bacterium]
MTCFVRFVLFLSAIALMVFTGNLLLAAPDGGLISHQTAEAHGLVRPWFTQVRLDPGRGRVSHVTFSEKDDVNPDTLFVQTDCAALHVIDAETGQTLWVKTIGRPDHPSLPLGIGKNLVSVVNGTNLYILKRSDGKLLWTGRINDVPVAGICMSKRHVFVPTISRRVVAYEITPIVDPSSLSPSGSDKTDAEKPKAEDQAKQAKPASEQKEQESDSLRLKQGFAQEVACGSSGFITSAPIIVRDDDKEVYIAWATSQGMSVAHISRQDEHSFPLLYELAGGFEIVSQPTCLPPEADNTNVEGVIFAASMNGSIYAHSEKQGIELWKKSIGQPIVEPVIPIGDRLYVTSELGGLYCLDKNNGDKLWHAPLVTRFVAASPTRLYVEDKLGRLLVLDAKNGVRIDTLPFRPADVMVCNMWTDRIYLITKTGLVQCLHEMELTKPVRHNQKAEKKPADEKNPKPKGDEKKEAPKAEAAAEDPFS